MKPRIVKSAGMWKCSDVYATAWGSSPSIAYYRWQSYCRIGIPQREKINKWSHLTADSLIANNPLLRQLMKENL